MDIVQQAIRLPRLKTIKDALLAHPVFISCINNGEGVSYFGLSGLILPELDFKYDQLEDYVTTLWGIFKEELWPLFSLVPMEDIRPASTGVLIVFTEAKEMAASRRKTV